MSTTTAPRIPPPRMIARLAELRAYLFLIFLIVAFELWSQISHGRSFVFNAYNIQSVAIFATVPLLLALGQTFVIISAGIDLSVGFVMGLASVVAAHAVSYLGGGLGFEPVSAAALGIAFAILVAAIPGLVNGLLISRLRVPAFIGTLGMLGVARGAAYLLAGGMTVPVSNPAYSWLGNGRVLGVPVLVLIVLVACVVMHYLLSQTRFGQHTYAMGASKTAAARAGIDTSRLTLRIYVLAAICAGLAGALYSARFSSGAAQAGEPLLLDSIAAVVIGGASLFGGSGRISGTIAGAMVIAVIQYGLVFINIEPFWQFVAVGVVIIISVLVDQSQRRLLGGREVD